MNESGDEASRRFPTHYFSTQGKAFELRGREGLASRTSSSRSIAFPLPSSPAPPPAPLLLLEEAGLAAPPLGAKKSEIILPVGWLVLF